MHFWTLMIDDECPVIKTRGKEVIMTYYMGQGDVVSDLVITKSLVIMDSTRDLPTLHFAVIEMMVPWVEKKQIETPSKDQTLCDPCRLNVLNIVQTST